MVLIKYGKFLPPALVISALALFFGAAIFFNPPALAQKLKQLPPPPAAPRLKPKPTPTPAPTPEPEYEVIRVSSNLVVVPVSVTDPQGQPVLGLKQTDFHIEEDGHPQEIAQLGDPEQVPLDIALLIDVSSSVTERFAFEEQAATRFLKQVLRPTDHATVYAIDRTPRLEQARSTADIATARLMSIKAATGSTGGTPFVPEKLADLDAVFSRILNELRAQYLLQYYSNNKSAGNQFRRITVTTPTQTQLRVRAREGYYPKAK